MDAHRMQPQQVLDALGVDAAQGLNSADVPARRERYGANEFTREKPPSVFRRILENLKDPMLVMLIIAVAITLGVNLFQYFTGGHADFVECLGIFIAIALSVGITVVMEGKSAKAFEALSRMNENVVVRVIRDGQTQLLPQQALVVGDVLLLGTGDRLPADGRLLESTALLADESSLTGESVPVHKDAGFVCEGEATPIAERANMLYSGCFVTGGSGKMVVTAVGDQTEFGKIARELTRAGQSTTPLQEKLAKLGKRIALLGTIAAALAFVVQLVMEIVHGTASFDSISQIFITSIVLVVAAVPEGLTTIVAVSLAMNVIKMSRNNALVKKMAACETVGSVNVICSDKTGTLTQNRMTVEQVCDHGTLVAPAETRSAVLLENFCINGTADVDFSGDTPKFLGNPTECALLVAARHAGQDYTALREVADVVHTYPFSSDVKRMTTIVRITGGWRAYMKGSPEKVLSMCASGGEGMEEKITSFQEKAFRVIGFAHRDFTELPDPETQRDEIEREMQFDGFVAIRDPIRPEVLEAVKSCRGAGIEVKMLTGDNLVTASAIATELGILDEGHVAVEAGELEALDNEALAARLPSIRVIARSTPGIKMRVVNALKARGNVVAVTGDGVNDAPAIKNADVGVAMGITGTEVSKEASDIVLLDDSFSTIVTAVQWGRSIFENFQRLILFQLTVNVSSVLAVLLCIFLGYPAPFTALQLLWINIIMDGPPALALGLEPRGDDLMQRAPTPRSASILTRDMLARIGCTAVYIFGIFLAQRIGNFLGAAEAEMATVLFTMFVVAQLFNALCCREMGDAWIGRHLLRNRLLLLILPVTFLLQVVIVQWGGALFDTVPLSLAMWGKILLVGLTVIPVSELCRLVLRLLRRRKKA